MTMPKPSGVLARPVTGWAEKRRLGPVSVSGISLALGVCAAGWFSGGTKADSVYGGLALCACYLAWRGARRLTRPDAGAGTRPRGQAAALVRSSATVSTCVSLAGLAAGGHAVRMAAAWELATAVVIVMSARDVTYACRGGIAETAPEGNSLGRAVRGVLMFPFGGRIALIAVVVPVWGPGMALPVLLAWAVAATGYALTGPRPDSGPEPVPGPVDAMLAAGGPLAAGGEALTDGVAVMDAAAVMEAAVVMDEAVATNGAGPTDTTIPMGAAVPMDTTLPMDITLPVDAAVANDGAGTAAALDLMMHADPGGRRHEAQEDAAQGEPRVRYGTLAARDDGAVALRLGRAVRGQFVPLPPALAGLAATSLLAWLGMRNLPGLLLLTPLVVMLLAGFGSTHPHDRELDWLTPAVLLAAQLEYAAAVGFSFRVPPPLTFTLCALIALRHVSLARGDQLNTARVPGARFGWEGRMLVVGAGAMLGIATIAYAALAVQVAWLVADTQLPHYAGFPTRQAHLRLCISPCHGAQGRADPRAKLYTRRRVAERSCCC